MVAKAYLPRDLAATADNDAQFMPALAVTSVLVMAALCIGYLCGRRAGSTRSGRIRRRRRTALAGMAFTVIALVVVRRARRSLRRRRNSISIQVAEHAAPLRFWEAPTRALKQLRGC